MRKAGLAFRRPASFRSFSGTAAARADFGHVVGLFSVSASVHINVNIITVEHVLHTRLFASHCTAGFL